MRPFLILYHLRSRLRFTINERHETQEQTKRLKAAFSPYWINSILSIRANDNELQNLLRTHGSKGRNSKKHR